MNPDTTIVRMLPICSCGQIIDNLRAEINVSLIGDIKYLTAKHLFFPSCCPNCGKYIKDVEIENKYLDMFHG